jgi:hypothetical protein
LAGDAAVFFTGKQRSKAPPSRFCWPNKPVVLFLPYQALQNKVKGMKSNWAEDNLQTIRTLMERSAVYRRALAPIMIYVGAVGIAGGLAGWIFRVGSLRGFLWLWCGLATISLIGAFLLVRRQALKDTEPFWSPPTRRIAQALAPAFFVGLLLAVVVLIGAYHNDPGADDDIISNTLLIFWTCLYGLAINSAGFFMQRGVRWLGWIFVLVSMGYLSCVIFTGGRLICASPHLLMGGIFGGIHFAYGVYLYFTEKKAPAA